MTTTGTFLKRLAIAALAIIALGAWPLMRAAQNDSGSVMAAVAGFVLSTANVLAGYYSILFARTKAPQSVNVIIFGSMTARMMLMLVLIIACIRVLDLPPIPFVISLFSFYLSYLVIEVHFLWRTSQHA